MYFDRRLWELTRGLRADGRQVFVKVSYLFGM